ncbi:TRAP transporter small permease [Halomonas dongshanensis]|uniref:TRAP transporter small permease protein n=1 Tax=Halomonas dongshanensis TaxID=2890835 RepID=A0ABT2EAZ3_9GAMM|nr:TRAP transporter small permease [Halomonas dongshanensis]MCS2608740.1 TRAP transporter small permease [Halomonas dongshanensis]
MFSNLMRIERWLERLEEAIIFTALVTMTLTLFSQVFSRFVLSTPLDFTEEVTRICMIWLVFIGSARALKKCEHFLVDFLVKSLPSKMASLMGHVGDAVTIVLIIALVWVGYGFVLKGAGQTMPALGVSVAVQTVAMPLGFAFMLFHCVCSLLRRQHINVNDGAPAPSSEV